MGLHDRAYQQLPPHQAYGGASSSSRMAGAPVVKWLLIINAAVWLLEMMTNKAPIPPSGYARGHDSLLWHWGHFSVGAAVEHFQIWRFFTFQFLHANGHHLLVNMIGLFFFGHFAERWWGSRKFLFFYLSTGVAGALFYVLLFYLGWFAKQGYDSSIPMVGASAGIFGILACVTIVAPNLRVLLFFFIPMSMRTFAILALSISVVVIGLNLNNAGGEAGHLGGAILGFILMRYPQLLSFVSGKRTAKQRRPVVDAQIVREKKIRPRININLDETEVDRILDKVGREGLQSLSEQEKEVLKRAAEQ
jgi:membrane associated rhomboid family serine protease